MATVKGMPLGASAPCAPLTSPRSGGLHVLHRSDSTRSTGPYLESNPCQMAAKRPAECMDQYCTLSQNGYGERNAPGSQYSCPARQQWLGQGVLLRMPGVEPGSQAWEACMMPLHYMRSSGITSLCRALVGALSLSLSLGALVPPWARQVVETWWRTPWTLCGS